MLGILTQDQAYRIVDQPDDARIIIVNTCAFIDASKKESVEVILEMAEWKERGVCELLVASGCMAQRYAEKLEKELPEVDLFIGTGQYHRIRELLETRAQKAYVDQPAFIHTDTDPRVHTGLKASAYLKLSEGCNRRCAFCIIPTLRGNVRSRTIASLVKEATSLVQAGVREINCVAQDLTEYGMEKRYRDEKLEWLLPQLALIEGLRWIRLHYVYPDAFSDELIDIVAREPKIVKYLDMPIQHTQDGILERMNRRLRRDRLFELIAKIRTRIPGIVFRTSIIVGFPGETEEDFQGLCQDLKALDLDHVGIFTYSQEEGTPAATMPDQVHYATKQRRKRILEALLEKARAHRYEKLIGTQTEVLLERIESGLLLGRMPTQAEGIDGIFYINDAKDPAFLANLIPGSFLTATITQANGADIFGSLDGPGSTQ